MSFSDFGLPVVIHDIETLSQKCTLGGNDKLTSLWLRNYDDNRCCATISCSDLVPAIQTKQIPLASGDVWTGSSCKLAMCNIDVNYKVIVYRNSSDNVLYIQLYEDVNGTLLWRHTVSTQIVSDWACVESIETNKVVLAYRDNDSAIGLVRCLTRSGNILIMGDDVAITEEGDDPIYFSIGKANNNKFIITYRKNIDRLGYCICGKTLSGLDENGRVITLGDEVPFSDTAARESSICFPGIDKFIILYDDQVPTQATAIRGTCSDLNIVLGNEVIVCQRRIYNPNIVAMPNNENWALCAYQNTKDGDKGKVNLVNVDWNKKTINAESEETFSENSIGNGTDSGLDITMINTNTVGIIYQDKSDGKKCKVICGNITIPS